MFREISSYRCGVTYEPDFNQDLIFVGCSYMDRYIHFGWSLDQGKTWNYSEPVETGYMTRLYTVAIAPPGKTNEQNVMVNVEHSYYSFHTWIFDIPAQTYTEVADVNTFTDWDYAKWYRDDDQKSHVRYLTRKDYSNFMYRVFHPEDSTY